MKTKDVMSKKLITVDIGTSLTKCVSMMKDRRIRHLPVLEGDEIVGILSYRDIDYLPYPTHLNVEDLMSRKVAFVNSGLSVKNTVFRMLEQKVSSLIVVDEDMEAVGIVTTDDMLYQLASLLKDDDENGDILQRLHVDTVGQVVHQLAQAGI